MMRSICRTTRWLITASLIVNLGLAGLFPRMMALADSGAHVEVAQKPTKCCCGTEDGRCCGMGCCMARQVPPKERCPSPNPKDSRDGQSNLLGWAAAKALLGAGGELGGSRFGPPESQVNFSLAESTLQAKHARIDA